MCIALSAVTSVKVVVKRYFDMFLRFVVLFVFIIAVGLIF
jgi:lipopolysaccharide/colanic/teichoic acid biosynthesis glycosyltransferase